MAAVLDDPGHECGGAVIAVACETLEGRGVRVTGLATFVEVGCYFPGCEGPSCTATNVIHVREPAVLTCRSGGRTPYDLWPVDFLRRNWVSAIFGRVSRRVTALAAAPA